MKTHVSPLIAVLLMGVGMTSLPAKADNLLSLYREAVQSDATYLGAQAEAKANRELKPQALSQLLPNVSFSGNSLKHSTRRTTEVFDYYGPSTGYVGKKQTQAYDYSSRTYAVGVAQPVFRADSYAAWRQSRKVVEGVEADLLWAEQQVGTRISEAYFKVLLAEANLEVTKGQRDAYLTQLDYAQKAFQTGAGTRTDVDEARAQLDVAAAQTIQQQYQLNYARDELKAIVERPLTPLARLNPERMQLAPPDPDRLEDWVQKAEEANPRLIALRASVEAANLQVKRALSGHLPTVDFVAQHVTTKDAYTQDLDQEYKQKDKVYGLRFDMPIFSGGATQSQVRQAGAGLERARQTLEEGRRTIGVHVRKEFEGVNQGVYWVRAFEQAVKSAEQAVASTRKGFQGGTRTTLDILISQQNLAAAKRDLNHARCDYVISRLRLLSLVGDLNEAEISRFNGWLEEQPE